MQNKLKPILIILGLVALSAIVYVFLIRKPVEEPLTRTSTATGVTTSASEPNSQVSDQVNVEEFQQLLFQLNKIQLNRGVFSKEQYPILIDHTQTALMKLDETKAIAPLGKQNPFQALGAPNIVLQASPVTPKSPR